MADNEEKVTTEEVVENKAIETRGPRTDRPREQRDNKDRENRGPRREFRRDNNRDNRDRGDRGDFGFRRMRRKICLLCKEKNYVLDYKDEETVKRFVNEKGKILPRRATGTCAKHQREIATVIKRARHIAVLPYVAD